MILDGFWKVGICDRSLDGTSFAYLIFFASLQDIWAMVFLAIQPNLASPDLVNLASKSGKGKGTKTAGERGNTNSMDSKVESLGKICRRIFILAGAWKGAKELEVSKIPSK